MTEDIKKDDVIDDKSNLENKSEDTNNNIKEPDIVTISPGLEEGPGPGVLDKIASVFRKPKVEEAAKDTEGKVEAKSEDVIDGTVSDKSGDSTDDSKGLDKDESKNKSEDNIEYEQIDQKFVDAAELYGWSNERIIEYADTHDDMDVIEITTRMEKSIKDNRTSASGDKPDKSVSSDSFINEEALKTLAEDNPEVAQAVRAILDPLAKRFENTSSDLNTLKGTLGNYESDRKAQEGIRDTEIANGIFDSSGVSSLGKTKDIPKYPNGSLDTSDPVAQERQKVWGVAHQFYAGGGTFESAMKNAMQWYHGSNANKDVKHKIIKELKKQEERIMPKRQESKVEKEFASDEERKAAVINDALRKYNREL